MRLNNSCPNIKNLALDLNRDGEWVRYYLSQIYTHKVLDGEEQRILELIKCSLQPTAYLANIAAFSCLHALTLYLELGIARETLQFSGLHTLTPIEPLLTIATARLLYKTLRTHSSKLGKLTLQSGEWKRACGHEPPPWLLWERCFALILVIENDCCSSEGFIIRYVAAETERSNLKELDRNGAERMDYAVDRATYEIFEMRLEAAEKKAEMDAKRHKHWRLLGLD